MVLPLFRIWLKFSSESIRSSDRTCFTIMASRASYEFIQSSDINRYRAGGGPMWVERNASTGGPQRNGHQPEVTKVPSVNLTGGPARQQRSHGVLAFEGEVDAQLQHLKKELMSSYLKSFVSHHAVGAPVPTRASTTPGLHSTFGSPVVADEPTPRMASSSNETKMLSMMPADEPSPRLASSSKDTNLLSVMGEVRKNRRNSLESQDTILENELFDLAIRDGAKSSNYPVIRQQSVDMSPMESADMVQRASSATIIIDENSMGGLISQEAESLTKEERVLRNWARLFTRITSQFGEGASYYPVQLEVLDAWTVQRVPWESLLAGFQFNVLDPVASQQLSSSICVGAVVMDESSRWQKFTVHPDSRLSHASLTASSLLIGYDLITFPFILAFQTAHLLGFAMMTWISTIFWTCDIALSLNMGYYSKGVIEMRPRIVLCHYLKTWFLPDLTIVISDWVGLVFELLDTGTEGSQAGILRVSRTFKYYRLLRIARMLRLLKVFQLLKPLLDGVASELMMVVGKLAFLIFLITCINHYIACAWYALAHSNDTGEPTWITVYTPGEHHLLSLYAIAMHWSMTQFTPSTQDVAPTNTRERLFAILVVQFALVMFSSFLSSLTNAMAQIKKIHYERYTEESAIRNFLQSRKVPLDFARQIWHFYRNHYRAASRRLHFGDISFLLKLPTSLRYQLHDCVNLPMLVDHTLFAHYARIDRYCLLAICDTSITEVSFGVSQDVFNAGEKATSVFILISGSMQYDCEFFGIPLPIEQPQFISEVAMWSKWVHCGHLQAEGNCEIVVIDVYSFTTTMAARADQTALCGLRKYANLFVQYVNDSLETVRAVTDIVHPDHALIHQAHLDSMAAQAFPGIAMDPSSRRKSSARSEELLFQTFTSLRGFRNTLLARTGALRDSVMSKGSSSGSIRHVDSHREPRTDAK